MIQKFKKIDNLAVFQNFNWDSSVKDSAGAIKTFREINILYGRNYSGKTTLSRIVRSMEIGSLSEKYENPQFQVQFQDGKSISPSNLTAHENKIRVFNEDFVRDNLRFISNSDDHIKSFAILGGNNQIEDEISALEVELGKNELGNETGLFQEKTQKEKDFQTAKEAHVKAASQLESQLTAKATGRDSGIKYQPARFGDLNYNIASLKRDLGTVAKIEYQSQSAEAKSKFERLIEEKALSTIAVTQVPSLPLPTLISESQTLVAKNISESNKIEVLLKNALLNKWVQDGLTHHQHNHTICAFCGNTIQESRWSELEQHFDEESRKLDAALDRHIQTLATEKASIQTKFRIEKTQFYSKFQEQVNAVAQSLASEIENYQARIELMVKVLKEKKEDKFRKDFELSIPDNTDAIIELWKQYEKIATGSNAYTTQLGKDQEEAKKQLRLAEVHQFATTIGYQSRLTEINELKAKEDTAKTDLDESERKIREKQDQIASKKRERNDEEKGAQKVNEYLNHHFGHPFLSLRAIKSESDPSEPSVRFEIFRGEKKAYHLSEGECSLLAFCYFLAKLDDVETKGSKPIVWIDDPISSLDSNHVFFVYSLIVTKIASTENYCQLFISTHNLDFLKYLKRLKGWVTQHDGRKVERQKEYFMIQRSGISSNVILMPKHLKEFVTEFHHLFQHLLKCSRTRTNDGVESFEDYQFANNARKFMEIYLHYKFPDFRDEGDKLIAFFGHDKVPAVLTDRINNEYSHLHGVFERGAVPVVVPEMKTAALQILTRIKELDPEQFQALLNSVGESESIELTQIDVHASN